LLLLLSAVLGFELRAYPWDCLSYSSSPFCSGSFGDRVSVLPRLAWTIVILFLCFPSLLGHQAHASTPCFFCWDGVSQKLFFNALAILELRSSWSQPPLELGITDAYYYAQLLVEMESHKLFAWAGLQPQSSQFQPPKYFGL
jgi:hypothetical protein